jgi:sulfatase maturation enzyme AslB (radical SAM superfamily)
LTALSDNKHLCALAWNHLHVTIEGRVAPCCVYTSYTAESEKLYNLKTHSLHEAINSPGMKEMRKAMIDGKPHGLCSVCDYNLANGIRSPRDKFNDRYLQQTIELIEKTNSDGSIEIDNFNPVYVDFRFSNLCNLRCRMCSIQASSAWYNETVEYNKLTNGGPIYYDKKFENNKTSEQVNHLLANVEHMYWAGGEPLLLDEHYSILKHLIETDRAQHVSLVYNTNMTISKYKGTPVVEYWKHFKHVFVVGSIDGIEEVSDYIRTGSSWEKTKEVFEEFKNSGYDNIQVHPCLTVSMLNILYVPSLIKWCYENMWFDKNMAEIAINFVDYPPEMCIKYMPKNYIPIVNELFSELYEWLTDNGHPRSIQPIEAIMKYIDGSDCDEQEITSNLSALYNRLEVYDVTGKLDWKSSLPELAALLKEYETP